MALGRALVRRPNCFLLDEPLSSLDVRLRSELRMEIKRMFASLGVTAIYVTHDQEEAMAVGGRIAVIHEGRVQQVGSPLDVFQHPRNRFVAQFLGSPPMNFLEGDIVAADGELWFTAGPLRLPLPHATASSLADRQTRLRGPWRPTRCDLTAADRRADKQHAVRHSPFGRAAWGPHRPAHHG